MKVGKTTDGLRKQQRETNGLPRRRRKGFAPSPPRCPSCGAWGVLHYSNCKA